MIKHIVEHRDSFLDGLFRGLSFLFYSKAESRNDIADFYKKYHEINNKFVLSYENKLLEKQIERFEISKNVQDAFDRDLKNIGSDFFIALEKLKDEQEKK